MGIAVSEEPNYKNNPLHGLSLKNLLVEIVDHYGFEILYAYLNINCFKTNPSIESSIKFLKKTQWACEKVEAFYMYQYKSLPRVSSTQFDIPPRDRIVPEGQVPGEPAELSIEDAERLSVLRAKKAAEHRSGGDYGQGKRYGTGKPKGNPARPANRSQSSSTSSNGSISTNSDPWANWKK